MGAGFEMYVMPCWGLMWFMSDDDCLIYSRGLYDQGYIAVSKKNIDVGSSIFIICF